MSSKHTTDNCIKEWFVLYSLAAQFGVMPNAGGLLDQDARTFDAFCVIMDEEATVKKQRASHEETRKLLRG